MESVPGALCSLLLILNPAGVESPQPVRLAPCPALHTRTASGLGPSVRHSPTSCLGELSHCVPSCIPPTVASTIYLDQWFLTRGVILPCGRHLAMSREVFCC